MPWAVAHQAPLSMGFPRQESVVGCHYLLQEIFLTQGSKPGLLHCKRSLAWQADSSPTPQWLPVFFASQVNPIHLCLSSQVNSLSVSSQGRLLLQFVTVSVFPASSKDTSY